MLYIILGEVLFKLVLLGYKFEGETFLQMEGEKGETVA
jgi:hypothetical protein